MYTPLQPESILRAVEEQLSRFHLESQRGPERATVSFEYESDGVSWEAYAYVTEDVPCLQFVAISPVVIRPVHRTQVGHLVEGINARANHGCLFFCGENDDHVAIRLTVPLLTGTDFGSAARFGISVCGNAFTQLGATLAAAALVPVNTSDFFKSFDSADGNSESENQNLAQQGLASRRVGLN
jgi:hypothetical protein